jgi:hypothetical protein
MIGAEGFKSRQRGMIEFRLWLSRCRLSATLECQRGVGVRFCRVVVGAGSAGVASSTGRDRRLSRALSSR